ncbi:hypothetical protein GCM10009596_20360 [Arthrobacter rhombi]
MHILSIVEKPSGNGALVNANIRVSDGVAAMGLPELIAVSAVIVVLVWAALVCSARIAVRRARDTDAEQRAEVRSSGSVAAPEGKPQGPGYPSIPPLWSGPPKNMGVVSAKHYR